MKKGEEYRKHHFSDSLRDKLFNNSLTIEELLPLLILLHNLFHLFTYYQQTSTHPATRQPKTQKLVDVSVIQPRASTLDPSGRTYGTYGMV